MSKPKQLEIKTLITIYEKLEELPQADALLLQEAEKALDKSYAPYSGFEVGAAAVLQDGTIISGANQENAAYPMCLCAEQVCLAAVRSAQPKATVVAMAITVRNSANPVGQPAAPCGSCRQVLSETEDRQKSPVRLILRGETGIIYVINTAKDILPLSFDQSFL